MNVWLRSHLLQLDSPIASVRLSALQELRSILPQPGNYERKVTRSQPTQNIHSSRLHDSMLEPAHLLKEALRHPHGPRSATLHY
jgi:hypothetical protein